MDFYGLERLKVRNSNTKFECPTSLLKDNFNKANFLRDKWINEKVETHKCNTGGLTIF